MDLTDNDEWIFSFSPSNIIYILPLNQEFPEFIPSLCGFITGFELYPLLNLISLLPNDINELSATIPENIAYRAIQGDTKIFVCDLQSMNKQFEFDSYPFLCFLSTSNTYVEVKNLVEKITPKPIHITTKLNSQAISIEKITIKKFKSEINRIITNLKNDPHLKDNSSSTINVPKYLQDKQFNNITTHYYHNITEPNRNALLSQHIHSKKKVVILPNKKEKYQEFIADSANFIINIKKKANVTFSKNDFILALPSINSSIYRNKEFLKEIQNTYGTDISKFYKEIIRKKDYVLELKIETDDYLNDPAVIRFLGIHQNDSKLITSILSILSSENFCPTYRLPNYINLSHDSYDRLASLSLSNKQVQIKLNRTFTDLINNWKEKIDESIINSIENCGRNGLIVSDYPLEWLCLDGVTPLCISHNICRINSSPGDLLIHQTCNIHNLNIPASSLSSILIIRSFKNDDPIRDCLLKAIQFRQDHNGLKLLNILIIDVDTEDELIDTLKKFAGKIVIFDCHGNHGGHSGEAWLNIGDNKINVWKLGKTLHLPPIFFLSACSTHPIDGSNSSIANGLISSGAFSVLATLLPIDAIHSSVFISKILHWIDFYLAMDKNKFPTIALWRDLIADIMRCMYASDILMHLTQHKNINNYQLDEILLSTQMDILYHQNRNWFNDFFTKIAEASDIKYDELILTFKKEFRLTNTLYYTHIGRPDKIIITN